MADHMTWHLIQAAVQRLAQQKQQQVRQVLAENLHLANRWMQLHVGCTCKYLHSFLLLVLRQALDKLPLYQHLHCSLLLTHCCVYILIEQSCILEVPS